MENILSVGDRLREERKRLDITQEMFAAIGEMSVQTQRSYEAGRSDPSTKYLAAIAAAGADVMYILTGVRSGASESPPLTREEAFVLETYRFTDEAGKTALRTTLSAFAQSKQIRESGKKAG